VSGDRYDISDTCYLELGIMRCKLCHLTLSQCDCDVTHYEDNVTHYEDNVTPARPNHFVTMIADAAEVPNGLPFKDTLTTLGYTAICQHLADLTDVLDRIARRSS
jgi:hypothetical protein